jgi:ABC-type phosphate/phosphonate transport system permease subunit
MVLPLLAPILATLASNGLGLVADAVTKKGKAYVEEKLGIDLTQDPTPEVVAQWQNAAREHEKELIAMVFADRANARNMQVEALKQNDTFAKRFIYYFATFWSISAALYIAFITFGDIPEANVRFADTILGFLLGTIVATIVQFFFGSSDSSKQKDNTLESLVQK